MNIVTLFKKYQKYFIAILLLSVLLLITRFISNIDFHTLNTYLYETPEMFVFVIITSFLAYLSSAKAWMLCMGSEGKKTSITQVFVIQACGRDARNI